MLFMESQTQPPSSAESLFCVECESDSAFLLSPVVVHKFQGRLSKSLLSLWRRLSHPSIESPCGVHIVREFDSALPVIVAAAQQTLAELVEGDSGAGAQQTLAKLVEGVCAGGGGSQTQQPLLSHRSSNSATLAELVEGVAAKSV